MFLSYKNKNVLHKSYDNYDYEISLIGNPNVGKSSIFNCLTGLKQHTGNWSGKTVENAIGYYEYNNKVVKAVDLPGTYSLRYDSKEEIEACEYIKNGKSDCIIIVADATNLERNLNLVLQVLSISKKVILCLNMIDEIKKNNVAIDIDELSLQLGIPVVCTSARNNEGLRQLRAVIEKFINGEIQTYEVDSIKRIFHEKDVKKQAENIFKKCSDIYKLCVKTEAETNFTRNLKIDKILTSKKFGIPIMCLFLLLLFWITIFGANYISEWLSVGFKYISKILLELFSLINLNEYVISFLIDGVYNTLTWVIAVMLPPMAIFFPLFSIMEDIGYLPRIAFNLDSGFQKCGTNGKQALTMAMGFGCNACGVVGCRIINTERERNIAILTNNFIPCNGRLPSLIAILTILISTSSIILNTALTAVSLLFIILFSVLITFIVSKVLSLTIYKSKSSSFVIELPPYRKPKILKSIVYAMKDRALSILLRAIAVAAPTGAIIWLLVNIKVSGISLLEYCTTFFDPIGNILGLDGVIITAFLLGFTANETVIPVILMSYTSALTLTEYSSYSVLESILTQNGWTLTTAICFMILVIFHYPCSTTCLTIRKESGSNVLTFASMILPTAIGICLCLLVNIISTYIV